MQSLRMLGRIVPKSSFRPLSSRSYSAITRSSLRPAWQACKKPSYPAFSTSIAKREPAGSEDAVLAAKFEHERALEIESNNPSSMPPEVETFKANSEWDITETPGTNEIVFKRTFGNETIRIEMNINDMTDMGEEDEFDPEMEDGALADEGYQQPRRTINQSGTKGGPIDVAPEDSVAPSDREGEDGAGGMHSDYPINLDIYIEKAGQGSLEIRAVVEDGAIRTEGVQYVPAENATSDLTTLFVGPPFESLDTELQAMFEAYLEERGINTELATIFPVVIEWKEQREYVDWLQNMKNFIEA